MLKMLTENIQILLFMVVNSMVLTLQTMYQNLIHQKNGLHHIQMVLLQKVMNLWKLNQMFGK